MKLQRQGIHAIPANSPIKKENESPFLFETDFLIDSKLKEAKLAFSNKDENNNEDISLKKVVEIFKNEILERHALTAYMFSTYCTKSLYENFLLNIDEKLTDESSDYAALLLMSTGFYQASTVLNVDTTISNEDSTHLILTVPGLFKFAEFDMIKKSLIHLIVQFPSLARNARKWVKEHVNPKNEQMGALKDFVGALSSAENWENNADLKVLAKKTLETIAPTLHGSHNLWRIQQLENYGMFSPPNELLLNTDRILNYLDILHYGGFACRKIEPKAKDLYFNNLQW